jgi:hypothetical protein
VRKTVSKLLPHLALVALSTFAVFSQAGAEEPKNNCATTADSLKKILGEAMKERWIETTADDGKPLKIIINTKNDLLYFVFDKTREGIWAEGKASVCQQGKSNKDLVLRVSGKDIKLGSTAPRPIKWSMGGGADFKLKFVTSEKLHVSTFGWNGDFIPGDELKPAAAKAK